MQLSCATLRIYERALLQHFSSSFRSRKKCEETTRLAKVEHVKRVIRVAQFEI